MGLCRDKFRGLKIMTVINLIVYKPVLLVKLKNQYIMKTFITIIMWGRGGEIHIHQ